MSDYIIPAVIEYAPDPAKGMVLATVDPAYTGVGNPRVTFDFSTTMSTATYSYIGITPGAGNRVTMQSVSDQWVISGVVGGSTGSAAKDIRMLSGGIIPATLNATVSPQKAGQLVVPDPGWPYQLCVGAQVAYEVVDLYPAVNEWDAVCVIDNLTTGLAISKMGLGFPNVQQQIICGYHMSDTIYTGSHTVMLALIRRTGTGYSSTGKLTQVMSEGYGGIHVIVVPT